MATHDSKKREKTVSILDRLFWSVQPPPGLIEGDYYRAEMRFGQGFDGDPGHLGILEAVQREGRLLHVEFNEVCSPTYYLRLQQNMSKRLSNYGFFQASKERTAETGVVLVNGLTHLERQMVEQNRLDGEFDFLAGASNSINRAMLPLARQLAEQLGKPTAMQYRGLSRPVEEGVTGRLQVVTESGRIIRCHYDEIFADRPEEIADPELRPYFRQSKYHAPEYISTIGMGFNAFSDCIGDSVLKHQSLTDLPGVPFQDCAEWRHYLSLAKELETCAAHRT